MSVESDRVRSIVIPYSALPVITMGSDQVLPLDPDSKSLKTTAMEMPGCVDRKVPVFWSR